MAGAANWQSTLKITKRFQLEFFRNVFLGRSRGGRTGGLGRELAV